MITKVEIFKAVSDVCCVPYESLISKGRLGNVVEARHIGIYIALKTGKWSLVDIGRFLGHRDHTTIMNGRDQIYNFIRQDDERTMKIFDNLHKFYPHIIEHLHFRKKYSGLECNYSTFSIIKADYRNPIKKVLSL